MTTRPLLPLCTLALLLAAPAFAQAPYATPEPAPAAPDGAPSEGIHVSGEWTIAVREPDGTVVEERTFHNALFFEAANLLAAMLAGELLTGYWVVDIGSPCLDSNGNPAPCHILEVSPTTAGWRYSVDSPVFSGVGFEALTVAVATPDEPFRQDELLLRGTITPNNTAAANITVVQTRVVTCDAMNRGEDCIDNDSGAYPTPAEGLQGFTSTDLDSPVSVDVGQSITVEVRISFGSATTASVTGGPEQQTSSQ